MWWMLNNLDCFKCLDMFWFFAGFCYSILYGVSTTAATLEWHSAVHRCLFILHQGCQQCATTAANMHIICRKQLRFASMSGDCGGSTIFGSSTGMSCRERERKNLPLNLADGTGMCPLCDMSSCVISVSDFYLPERSMPFPEEIAQNCWFSSQD